MQSSRSIQLYETGRRGRPIALIAAGDLDDPYPAPSLWKRIKSGFATFADVVREARELEAQTLAWGRLTRFRDE